METAGPKKERYHIIDALRGFSLLNMIAFHFCYDYFVMFSGQSRWYREPFPYAWQLFICCSFIFISGVSMHFATHAIRRGLMLNAFGLGISLITYFLMPSEVIWFGILNFLGCMMLITCPLRRLLDRVPAVPAALCSFGMFGFLFEINRGYAGWFQLRLLPLPDFLYDIRILTVLGFPDRGFHSSDFFSIFPWAFLFLTGYWVWSFLVKHDFVRFLKFRVPVLATIGRYTIWIYLIHQPVLLAICCLIFQRLPF